MSDNKTASPTVGPDGQAFSAYQLTLAGLRFPIVGHAIFNGTTAIAAALLGHPVIGAVVFVSAMGIDILHQTLTRRWLAAGDGADEAWGFLKLSALMFARICTYVAPTTAMVLMGRGLPEMAFFGAHICLLITLALASGSLSRLVFWAFATPVLAAGAIVALTQFGPVAAGAVLLVLVEIFLLLMIISDSTIRAISTWHQAFKANLALVADLETARDQAIAERAAADEAREEARQANRAKSNFLATMSHEIRTPMNGVLGMAQLLKRDETDPRQIERLDTLIDSGEYLLSILNDILDVSKIDAGRLEIVPRPEDLGLLMDRLIGFWGGRADEKGVTLGLTIAPGTPDFVMADALRLRQVLFNLVGNALKFTDQGSVHVTVSARPMDDGRVMTRFSVCDTGPGIPAKHLPLLFDRFAQGEETEARKFGGTGLGLAIVRQLTELMGGRTWAESEVGEGSTFYVELPLALTGSAPAAPASLTTAKPEAVGGLSILAVDDNAVNLLVLDQLLAAFGARIAKAASGAEALDLLAAQPFDLVLMDIQMPGMTGIEALRRLRETPGRNQAVPVVALTADVTSGGRDRYIAMGFTEHTPKPIQIAELMDAIGRAMDAPPPANPIADVA